LAATARATGDRIENDCYDIGRCDDVYYYVKLL